jgi:hypothetical protein
MEGFLLLAVIVLFVACCRFVLRIGKQTDTRIFRIEFICCILYLLILFGAGVSLLPASADFNESIDPVDQGYTPFSSLHLPTLLVFFSLFLGSALLVWIKGRQLPPLTLVLALVFLLTGAFVSVLIFFQAFTRKDPGYGMENTPHLPLVLAALATFVIATLLIIRIIRQSADLSQNRTYNHKLLHYFNQKLADVKWQPLWVLLLLFPVFAVITGILCLFGQAPDALLKVFTETATWGLSQKAHPPYLGHEGHYLCTVAACGDPKVVKPVRIGQRHGHAIIVNRQLMVANAYEEMIRDYSPRFHRFVRFVYDKYGYGFSKHINTPRRSNLTYLAMKPLEWLFLLKLYLFCAEPEAKICRQYAA